jgi:type II secretory pathway component PulF
MTSYAYRARNQQGQLVAGDLELESETAVAANLDKLGYTVLDIKASSGNSGSLTKFKDRFQGLKKQEVIIFSRQLSTLIRSGMPLLPALSTICEQVTNKKFKVILEDVRQSVQAGSSFSDALAKYPGVFSELFVSMVRVGETGGIMDQVLDRLSELGTQEMEITSRVQSAMTYPIVLVGLSFLIVNFILVGVLPKFVMVFKSSQSALPLPTTIVLAASWIMQKFWLPILAVLVAGIFYFRRVTASGVGRVWFHRWLLKVPIFGDLYMKIQVSRFARTLSTLTSSGVPILQALTVVEKTITNVVIQKAIQDIRLALSSGSSLVEPFKASGLFSPMVVQMVSIGEKSGSLDLMLEEVAKFYDPEIEYTIKNLTSLLEPFMLLAMGLMVAFIALSVLLPIFNLMKVFKG